METDLTKTKQKGKKKQNATELKSSLKALKTVIHQDMDSVKSSTNLEKFHQNEEEENKR